MTPAEVFGVLQMRDFDSLAQTGKRTLVPSTASDIVDVILNNLQPVWSRSQLEIINGHSFLKHISDDLNDSEVDESV